jgi:hypothetical protein
MKSLRRVLIWLLAAACAHGLQAQTVEQILASLGEISGMKAVRAVVQSRMTREQMRVFFDKRIKQSIKPEQLRIEELALKKFGLVPADFDLGRTTLDLLSEQAAAFYDYEKGNMVMAEGGTGELEKMALVHELAHALADQHFKIGKYLRGANGANDADGEPALARQAVVEGQAQWLTTEYMARQVGQSLLTSPSLASMMMGAMEPSGQYPVYDKVPQYLRESLVFPYAAGMQFQQAVLAKLGKAGFARVFEKAPLDSHEILHPDLYLQRTAAAVPVRAPMLDLGKDTGKAWKEISEGVVGEFDHQMMLKLYAKDQMALAADWRAAHFRLWESKRGVNGVKPVALTYVVRWSSPAAARTYLAAYLRVLAGKWADFRLESESETEMKGTGGGGRFEVKLEDDTVVSHEGLPLVH